MSRLILLPEDDEPHLTKHSVDRLSTSTEAVDLLRRFNPQLVGFGIVAPWKDSCYRTTRLTVSHHQKMINDEDPEEKK
jgi:hypothetical protein